MEMTPFTLLPFLILGLSILSLWIYRSPKIWGTLLISGLIVAFKCDLVTWSALLFLAGWTALWFFYTSTHTFKGKVGVFISLVLLSFGFKFHVFPGFNGVLAASKLSLRFDTPLVGFFPLALLVPLASSRKEWAEALLKPLWLTFLGIGAMAALTLFSGSTQIGFKWPSSPVSRYLINLIFVAIPEEGFYRGFVQDELRSFFKNQRFGAVISLLLSSAIFTLAHIFWSPNFLFLGFIFLAGLLYGGVYLLSRRIESAIFCHFLLNFIHMTFFSYHAM